MGCTTQQDVAQTTTFHSEETGKSTDFQNLGTDTDWKGEEPFITQKANQPESLH